jgi:transposase-like protein
MPPETIIIKRSQIEQRIESLKCATCGRDVYGLTNGPAAHARHSLNMNHGMTTCPSCREQSPPKYQERWYLNIREHMALRFAGNLPK